ncbi:hypothetical protein FRC98_00300 [Lujinxingia vulgaris]|uniref:Uncharacterized protein n=1 Tax=Lujinxingia vulgaris TaxID=2600176 RepID=A0A5C6XIY4_9DELT|nr:hypothetical protein [Lujinxingia vulgaris]TXD38880.1 hypothetical protein FRC98_00300 [Lujinxingia vulgaris]
MPRGCTTIGALLGTPLFGLVTLAMIALGLLVPDQRLAGTVGALIFGALTLVCAVLAVRNMRVSRENAAIDELSQEENRILRFAQHNQGRLTVEEAALGCHLSVEQARQLLDRLVVRGSADTWVSDAGALVYVFHGLSNDQDKLTAEDPFLQLES